ncbi:MAG: hypothetical protein IJU69_00545 [Bacteroidales bacterium]|nr:hypothetical protein [Bacteroidales bacterium]
MLRRAFISLLSLVLGCFSLSAQDDFRKAFEDFTQSARERHIAFTDTANVAFAKVIGAEWSGFELSDGIKRQTAPEPETLPVAEDGRATSHMVTVSETVDTIPGRTPPETGSIFRLPGKSDDRQKSRPVKFIFYDTEQVVSVPKEYGTFHPGGISEKDVASFWEELSRCNYKTILEDCAKYAETYGYNDWAVLEWVQALSAAVFPGDTNSEQTIFTVFLLNQMGLSTKIARAGGRLTPLFSSMQPVYARKFVIIDTYPFYLAGKDIPASTLYTYNADFTKAARPLDLRIPDAPSFGKAGSYKIYRKNSSIFAASFDLPVNQTLMRFYDRYPQTSVNVYASARPEARFAAALTKAIGDNIRGLGEVDAVNRLLAFVQTDFGYQTDMARFGYEKPFFCEENFIYDSNDCEDRAVLFAYLLRSVLGKKAVLLEYPDHTCAAVCLKAEVKGDYIRIGNDKYYVCDPSYIGAAIGMSISKYKNTAVKVYVLQ